MALWKVEPPIGRHSSYVVPERTGILLFYYPAFKQDSIYLITQQKKHNTTFLWYEEYAWHIVSAFQEFKIKIGRNEFDNTRVQYKTTAQYTSQSNAAICKVYNHHLCLPFWKIYIISNYFYSSCQALHYCTCTTINTNLLQYKVQNIP